jgi:hypothetical protein
MNNSISIVKHRQQSTKYMYTMIQLTEKQSRRQENDRVIRSTSRNIRILRKNFEYVKININ